MEHLAQVNGKKAFYWTAGDATKPAVVFLHGFPGNHQGMLWLANFFVDDYFVIMPDFPGCGQSEGLGKNHGIESHAEWLNDFLQTISVAKPVIIGHSFGARVATYFAAHYPDSISAVVLLTPVVRIAGFWGRLATSGFNLAKLMPIRMQKRYLSNAPYQHFAFWLAFKSDDKETRSEIVRQSLAEVKKLDPKIHLEMLDDLYAHDLEKWGKSIAVPCLLIAGMKDDIVSVASVESFMINMKNAKLEVMENTGHLLPIEHPEFTAKTIKTWLCNL